MSLKSNTKFIGEHTYLVGKCAVSTLTLEQSIAIRSAGNISVFFRMIKDGVLYHSTAYSKSKKTKRDDTYCQYRNETIDSLCIGRLELFLCCPMQPHA